MKWLTSLIALLGSLAAAFGQPTTVSGTVVAAKTGETLPQISVYFGGTSIGTITNSDGFFRLWTKQEVTNLVFEAAGYMSKQIRLSELTDGRLLISLEKEAILDDLNPTKFIFGRKKNKRHESPAAETEQPKLQLK